MMTAFFQDWGLTREIVERAVASGATAVCVTTTFFRGFNLESWPTAVQEAMSSCITDLGWGLIYDGDPRWDRGLDPSPSWADVDRLREICPVPLVLKGIMTAEDGRAAADHGASAIVVSNHGGYFGSHTLASAEMLPEVIEAVGGRLEVLVDGGLRSGTDVFRALALGARAVMIGRPNLWGLAAGGADGVKRTLALFREGLERAMALVGAGRIEEIKREMIQQRSSH